ncbi:MAG TPA: hypothetical protein VFS43_17190 [Polyangiaceae bacterium]|nr:hypothetical protein [Polyangiaceae bacterium]
MSSSYWSASQLFVFAFLTFSALALSAGTTEGSSSLRSACKT